MDTMYRNKAKTEENQKSTAKNVPQKHISDNYKAKVKPRQNNADLKDADANVSKNLSRLNKDMIQGPSKERRNATAAPKVRKTEDSGAKVITEVKKVRRPVPLGLVFGIIIVTIVMMYTLSLNVKINEYNTSIAQLESRIVELQTSAERLDTKLESKYDLAEIQRIATEEYGMVSADSLPKKYLSVASSTDVAEAVEEDGEKSGLEKLISGFASAIRGILE